MSRSELRAEAAANEPGGKGGADGSAGRPAKTAAAASPQADAAPLRKRAGRPPWLVRHSRKVLIALGLATLAALPFAYVYLRHTFGPDPLAGIRLEGVKFDPLFATPEAPRVPERKPPAVATVQPAPKPAAPGPKQATPRPVEPADKPLAAAPAARAGGVTHTQPDAAAPAATASRQKGAEPREPEAPQRSGGCLEAVAALGLCNPNATGKGK